MDSIQPGQMLGQYRILGPIGQGGMATVYKAQQAAMERTVAIKILPRQLADSPEFSGRFQQEARTIANLEHPHILPVHDYGESGGVTYLVMRYLEAGTLRDRLKAGPLPLDEIDRMFTQLADALGYAHARQVVHRDLKPANVLIDAQGNVFLTDFGIAKLLAGETQFTTTGSVMGTPDYISPEQAQGQKVDQRADIYSLGIMLYEMVTGRVPYAGDTPLVVMLKHVQDPLPRASAVKPDVPPAIEQVILKALAKDPAQRFGSAAEFLTAWKQALAQSPAQAPTQLAGAPTALKPGATPAVVPIQPSPSTPNSRTGVTSMRRPNAVPTALLVSIAAVVGAFVLFVLGGIFVAVLLGGKGLPLIPAGQTPTVKATLVLATEAVATRQAPTTVKATMPPGGNTIVSTATSAPAGVTELAPALPPTATPAPTRTFLNVTNNPGRSEVPQLAFDSQGILHFVWYDTSLREVGGDILHRQMTADGKWSEAENLTEGWQGVQPYDLALRLNPNGQVCAFLKGYVRDIIKSGLYTRCLINGQWSEAERTGKIYDEISPAFELSGTVRTLQKKLNELYFDDFKLSDKKQVTQATFAIDKSGTYHAVWIRAGEPFSIEYRSSKDGGKTWSEAERLSDDGHMPGLALRLMADLQGNVHLIWDGYSVLFYRRWTPTGGWEPTINIQGDASSGSVNMTVDAAGLVYALWQGPYDGVWYTHQSTDGAWSTPNQLSTDNHNWGGDGPAIAVDGKGTLHFVWAKDGDDVDDLYYTTLP